MTPHFEHDCGAGCCIYVGSTAVGCNVGVFDLYVSKNMMREPALLLRYSSDGPDYRFAAVEQYRRSASMSDWPEITKALEMYDEFISNEEAGNGHA